MSPSRSAVLDRHECELGPTGLPVLTSLDIALGWPLGFVPPPRPPDRVDSDPVRALRNVLLPALRRTPCVVAFSGGRDSSVLLAHAADLAASEGLDPPIALTSRFPGDAASDESEWQDLVVGHLRGSGLRFEWVCEDLTTELDNIGSLAAPLLRAHGGPTFPAGVGNSVLLARRAVGGSLVTGISGDEVLGNHRIAVLRTLVRRCGRGLRSQRRLIAASCAPARLRHLLLYKRFQDMPWLRGEALRAALTEGWMQARAPLRWTPSVWATRTPRALLIDDVTRRRVCADYDCRLVEPFGAVEFVASWAAFGGSWGGVTRTDAIRLLADGLLPEAIIRRWRKAWYNTTRFTSVTREFVDTWDGSGVDPDLVDAERLRTAWLSEVPPGGTGMLLQQAWLASRAAER